MILLRPIEERDIPEVFKISQVKGFLNAPRDEDQLRSKIARSQKSFSGKIKDFKRTKYHFVAEDLESGKVVATSMISGQHGTEESPHFYFQVGKEEKFSKTINTGFIHGTLLLKYDTQGPTEIGGIVVDRSHRGSSERVGRQISFVRFLYMGLNRDRFKDDVLVELLPPFNDDGESALWEAVGRRFTNMDYQEADQLCQKNKEFIFSLFPTGKIYSTFLSAEARDAIGKVGKETEPAYHMLTKIGFEYRNHVDPFDGGPHLEARMDQIRPIQNIKAVKFSSSDESLGETREGLLAVTREGFRAVAVGATTDGERLTIKDPDRRKKVANVLSLTDGESVSFMPYY